MRQLNSFASFLHENALPCKTCRPADMGQLAVIKLLKLTFKSYFINISFVEHVQPAQDHLRQQVHQQLRVTPALPSNASQLASNLQKSPETVINQYYDRNTNPSAGLEYVSNQVISGQPSQFVAASPPPIYEYRTTDPRVSANAYNSNQWNAAAPAAVAQTSAVVKEPRINEEI